MQFIILRKILASNQEIFACASNEKIDTLLQDDWMFYLTNNSVGYVSEGEALKALSDFKNHAKKIDLRKRREFAKLN